MKKYSLLIITTIIMTFMVAVGIANALPTAGTDLTTVTSARFGTMAPDNTNIAEHNDPTPITDRSYGPHGKFTSDTNACGRCHQLHQAKAARLFRFDVGTPNNAIYGICTYCHNFNGQSTYDVKDGMIWDTQDTNRYATNGGGFERQLVVEGPAAVATVVKASSSHQVNQAYVDGASTYARFNAPGASTGKHFELRCSSCHNPHGSTNARALVEKVVYYDNSAGGNASTKNVTDTVPEFVQNRFANEQSVYPLEISKFCATCHADYLNTSNQGQAGSTAKLSVADGGDQESLSAGQKAYRHMINMAADNPLNKNGAVVGDGAGFDRNDGSFGIDWNTLQLPMGVDKAAQDPLTAVLTDRTKVKYVVCTSCHFAHGTGAEMTQDVINGTNQTVQTNNAVPANNYSLTTLKNGQYVETIKNLRMDNRAVCQNCHNRNSVDSTGPVVAKLIDPANAGTLEYSNNGNKLGSVNARIKDGATQYVTVRFDQYLSKTAAETVTNYRINATPLNGGNGDTATLQPDGRTVLLKITTATIDIVDTNADHTFDQTLTVTNGVKNINNKPLNATSGTPAGANSAALSILDQ